MSFIETKKNKDINEKEIEIRLSDIVQFLKNGRRKFLLGALLGLLIGALYAFSKADMYTSQVTVMPEIQAIGAGGLGNLGSLVGLAGIGIDNAGAQDVIRPDLYPNILQSIPFALHLLKQPVYSQKLQERMTLQEFVGRIESKSFINKMRLSSDNDGVDRVENLDPKNFSQAIQLTRRQEQLIKLIQANVIAAYDRKTGILTLSAVEQDPVVAATIARLSLEYLTNYIITYRTEKASKHVNFLSQRLSEAKARYQMAEYAVSNYRDRNRNLFLNTAKIDEQRLQADYLLEQSVYNELSKQLEQAKIKVQDETPVFKILEPPTVPLRKSGPKRTMIMLGFSMVGIVISVIIALIRYIPWNIKSKQTA
ncbi:hypothetical protein GCM10028808_12020 [Spirosoma migulaei]